MRKIMVFQHVGHEPLGTLDPMLKGAGFRIRYVNFGRNPHMIPSVASYNGLIVLGGPMGVYEADQIHHLRIEMAAIEEALKKNIPILGICLGAQLLAAVLGAKVEKAPQWEFGWTKIQISKEGLKDRLFDFYNPTENVFQIHQDTFSLPHGSQHLASSSVCEGQAFSYNDNAYGLQFHLEADQAMIYRWLQRPENQKLMTELNETQQNIETATQQFMNRSLALSQYTFSHFINLFNLPEKKIVLGSDHAQPPKGRRR